MRPTITLQKKISYPVPADTTAVAELRVTASSNIDDAIFVCRYIPVSSVQEAHYEFYNVAYADQMRNVPTEPEMANRVCFVRRSSADYYASSPLVAQQWCNEVYKEIQRLLQSYNVNYPLGSCDKVSLTENDIRIVSGVPEDIEDTEDLASGGIFLVKEDENGNLHIPDGHYPVGIEYNDVIYRISNVEHNISESEFIVSTEPIRAVADIGVGVTDWKVWCFFGENAEDDNTVINTCGTDPRIVGTVVNAVESDDGHIEIPDSNYPVGLEHNGRIYNINEVVHDEDKKAFILRTDEVRVLADFNGVKTYWRVWCVVKNQTTACSDADSDDSVNGMIW